MGIREKDEKKDGEKDEKKDGEKDEKHDEKQDGERAGVKKSETPHKWQFIKLN